MSAAGARLVVSTAFAAVALVLTSNGSALAAPPTCTPPPPQSAVTGFPQAADLSAYCSDLDFDALSYAVSTAPLHGAAQISGDFLSYTSTAGYVGPDSVSFTASAGGDTTAPATVSFTVVANQPPTCPTELELEVERDVPTSFDPYFDCDDDAEIVDFPIIEAPDHGTLDPYDEFEGLLYTPASGFTGPDTFTVVAEDHAGERSEPIAVTVTVLAPNRAPSCVVQLTVRVPIGGRVTVDPRTTCSDPDGDPVSFMVVTAPANGRLEPGGAGTLDYVPDFVFAGYDRLLYRVRDPAGARSNLAALDFLLAPPSLPALTPDLSAPDVGVARADAGKLGAVRRHGLRLRLSSSENGTALVRLSITKQTARRLRIERNATGPVEVGRLRQILLAGDTAVVVRLTTRARRGFGRTTQVVLTVVATIRDHAGNVATERRRMSLRR